MALVTILFLAASALHAQNQGAIEGRVTNSVTGEGVPGVRARFLNKGYVYEAATDASGSFHLGSLSDGEYRSEFMKDGYSVTGQPGTVQVAGSVPATFNLQLRPWGGLRGRVLDDEGKPAAGVKLEMGRGIQDDVATNAQGEFSFKEVAPGSYTLVAKPPPKVRVQDGVRLGTVAIYYPSGTEASQAVPIVVRAGEDVSGIEVRLKSVPVHRIAGMVLDPSGKPVPNSTVKLLGRAGTVRRAGLLSPIMAIRAANVQSNGFVLAEPGRQLGSGGFLTTIAPGPEPVIAQTESRADGAFEFAAVESGEWRVSAETGVYEEMAMGNVVSAFLGEKDIDDLQIQLAPTFAQRSTADSGDAKVSDSAKRLMSGLSLDSMEDQPHVYGVEGQQRRPGLLPGRYRVMPSPITQVDDFYVSAILWGGRDVLGQVVEIGPGADPFQVVYKTGLAAVHGTVENGAGALVLLVPRSFAEVVSVRTITCGADGTFALEAVPPGDYGIVAFDHGEQQQIQWSSLDSLIVPQTSSLHIDSASTAMVNLRANPWPW